MPERLTVALRIPCGEEIVGAQEHRRIVDLAMMAEQAGFDTIVVADHVLTGSATDQYPCRRRYVCRFRLLRLAARRWVEPESWRRHPQPDLRQLTRVG